MAMKFVTTDMLKWGAGTGVPQDAVDVDENFWLLSERIAALEALPGSSAAIEDFVVDGDQFTVIMDDYTIFGPYTLPMWVPTFAGTWDDATSYSRGTILTANGKTYLVLVDHTSEEYFDEDANDGLGNDYYGVLLENPAAVLPTGGAVGMALVKSTSNDFEVTWSNSVLPAGGTTAQKLVKTSNLDYETEWTDDLLSSLGDITIAALQDGDVLTYNASEDAWFNEQPETQSNRNPVITQLSPSTGSAVLDPTLGDIYWVTPTGNLDIEISDDTQDGARITILFYTSGSTSYEITFSGLVDYYKGTLHTGVWTNRCHAITFVFDGDFWVEESRSVTDRQSEWIPASDFVPRTTNGAAFNTIELAGNLNMLQTLDFDSSTAEYAQFNWVPPKRWDGVAIYINVYWSHPSTTVNFGVHWNIGAMAVSNDDPLDPAYSSSVAISDTGGTTDDLYISTPGSLAINPGGSPADADMILFRVHRNPANVGDTLAVDARLHGILITYTTNQATDD